MFGITYKATSLKPKFLPLFLTQIFGLIFALKSSSDVIALYSFGKLSDNLSQGEKVFLCQILLNGSSLGFSDKHENIPFEVR